MNMTFHNKQKTFPSLVKLVPCHTGVANEGFGI